MIIDLTQIKIYFRPERTNMRKATNGLTVIVHEVMKYDQLSRSVFFSVTGIASYKKQYIGTGRASG